MGINGLWELVKPAGVKKTIGKLAEENGYSYEARTRMLRIGVDISVMLDECIAATHAANLYAQFHGGPLRIFFYKLCQLLKCPAIFIFVFDGPKRPSIKRDRKINTEKSPWWYEPCMELIKSMGFYGHQAPGEAEAELARLNAKGIIDAVISNDGDALVFGARQLLRRVPKSDGVYSVYTMDTIREATNYGPSDLLLLALISGGDYSKGVKACGISVVTALVKCGFGIRLGKHLATLEDIKLDCALNELVEDIKHELRTNSKGFLSSRQPALAGCISSDFLNSAILSLYIHPITSWSPGHHLPDDSHWIAQEPDILDIIWWCMKNLGWNSEEKLSENLHNTLLEGLFVRALLSPDVFMSQDTKDIETNTQCMEIVEFQIRRRKNYTGPPWGRLLILVKTARDAITTVGGKERDLSAKATGRFSIKVWVPLCYLPPATFSLLSHPHEGLKWAKTSQVGDDSDLGYHNSQTSHSLSNSALKELEEVDEDLPEAGSLSIGHRHVSPFPLIKTSHRNSSSKVTEVIDLTLDSDDDTHIIDLTNN